jgi:hypothetical protein
VDGLKHIYGVFGLQAVDAAGIIIAMVYAYGSLCWMGGITVALLTEMPQLVFEDA